MPDPVPQSPPKLATRLLTAMLPAELRDCVTGDLSEEFYQRSQQDKQRAKQWYWRQTMLTTVHYLSQSMASEAMLKKLVIIAALVLFPSLIIMVSWLSNMTHDTQENIWNNLLAGKIHSFLFEAEVIILGTEKFISEFDLLLYFNVPAALWSVFAVTVLYFLNKKDALTAHRAAGWGLILMLLPYIFGLIYIEIIQPAPHHVGPPVAFMALSVAYLILPLSWFVLSKINK